MILSIKACVADDVEYDNGETWTSANDPCETCVCEEGITTCQRLDKCPVECDHGAIPRGQCCSPCTGEYTIPSQHSMLGHHWPALNRILGSCHDFPIFLQTRPEGLESDLASVF